MTTELFWRGFVAGFTVGIWLSMLIVWIMK